MKTLALALTGLLFTISAHAETPSVQIEKTVTELRPIAGELIGTSMVFPNGPSGAIFEPMGTATIGFKLSGCLNDVVLSSHAEVLPGRKVKVVISALELIDSRSTTALCVAVPTKVFSVPLYVMGGIDKKDVSVEFTSNLLN